MQTKVPYSGKKKKCQKGHLLVRKRTEHQNLRKEGIGQLYCFVQMQSGLCSGLPFSKKLLTPEPWKDKHQLPVFWLYSKKAWTMRSLFLDWFHWCFFPEVRKYLASKGLPFKVLLTLHNVPSHPETHEFNTEGIKVVYLPPNTTSLIQPLDQGVIRTFKTLYKGLSTLWKRTLMKHHKSLEGLHDWRCHHC